MEPAEVSAMHMSASTRKLRAMEGWLPLFMKGGVVGVLYGGAERLRPSRDMCRAPSVPDALLVLSPLVLLLRLLPVMLLLLLMLLPLMLVLMLPPLMPLPMPLVLLPPPLLLLSLSILCTIPWEAMAVVAMFISAERGQKGGDTE